ncbi:MAG: hypothetical protein E7Z84_06050 [Methanosphaera stadtmanae]|nr:hypothetical protein [Methanosphaera stadtmanae]
MIFKKIINKIFKSDETNEEETVNIYTGKYDNFIREQNSKQDSVKVNDDFNKATQNIQENFEITLNNNLEDKNFDELQHEDANYTNENLRLDDLEKEYEKNLKEKCIRYTLKYTIVLYLNQIIEHPLKSDLWVSNHIDEVCSKEQIEEYVFNKKYIKEAEGTENLKNIIPSYTVAELKEVLKKYDLKVSGRKQELINRLNENLTLEELCEEFNKPSYIVTEEGLKLIKENPQVILFKKYFSHHDLNEYEKYYQENKIEDMQEFSINYLIYDGEKNIEKCNWFGYYWQSIREIAYLYFDYKEFDLSLKYFMQLIICELSFWEDNFYAIDFNVFIHENYIKKLLETVEVVKLDVHELKQQFYNCYSSSKVPLLIIPKEEMFKYFLAIINGTAIENINKEIQSRITVPENLRYELHFDNTNEMNELVEKLRQYEIYK